jgi:hypothetical protein
MQMIPVESSNVEAVAYDEATLTLHVSFRNGSLYEYSRVPTEVFRSFLDAPSKGSFVHEVLRKGGYSYRRIR